MRRLLRKLGSALRAYTRRPEDRATAEERALAQWELEPLPLPAGTRRPWINVIRGCSTDDVWLMMNGGTGAALERLVFHYDGRRWSLVPDVPPKSRSNVYPIGRSDVWTIGRQGVAAHFDGRAWTEHKVPGVEYDLIDMFARPDDVWIVTGRPNVHHFDGEHWTVHSPPELAGTGVRRIWGTFGHVYAPVNPRHRASHVARFDGEAWQTDPLDKDGVWMIGGSAPSDVWVLGGQRVGWHYDGDRWTKHHTHKGHQLWALSVASEREAYAVGDDGVILRWDGDTWQRERSPTHEALVSVFANPGGKALIGGVRLYRRK